jgi:iron(II)-dependent oxidoreductase
MMDRTITAQTSRTTSVIDALAETRERTLALVAPLTDGELERVYSPLMSPLVWDLAHIAAFEDLWLAHRYGGRPLLRADLAEIYDALETPRANRGEREFLRAQPAREYLQEVRARTLEVIDEQDIGDGILHELVIRHEQQHTETMLQTIQLARLGGYELPAGRDRRGPDGHDSGRAVDPPQRVTAAASQHTGLALIEIPAGECTIGAGCKDFAYDNERPRHAVTLGGYLIGATPVTNAGFLAFVQDGGYERREWWTEVGWAWRRRHEITRPGTWSEDQTCEWRLGRMEPLGPGRAVTSISWYEADAFARAHGARLPTETEWEKAASWDPELGLARAYPWGEAAPVAGVHANVDQVSAGPEAVAGHPAGASAYGALDMIGNVWEWTMSDFCGYEDFIANPYREYSEVFFGSDYKVLRGGSWATRARLITPTFRNWDYPQRRQIFAGFRIARDA